jgi:hypothetical protein
MDFNKMRSAANIKLTSAFHLLMIYDRFTEKNNTSYEHDYILRGRKQTNQQINSIVYEGEGGIYLKIGNPT